MTPVQTANRIRMTIRREAGDLDIHGVPLWVREKSRLLASWSPTTFALVTIPYEAEWPDPIIPNRNDVDDPDYRTGVLRARVAGLICTFAGVCRAERKLFGKVLSTISAEALVHRALDMDKPANSWFERREAEARKAAEKEAFVQTYRLAPRRRRWK